MIRSLKELRVFDMKQKEKLVTLFNEIEELIQYALDWEKRYAEKIEQVHPKYTESARNLVHYCYKIEFLFLHY